MEPNQTPNPSPRNRLSSGILAAGAAFAMTLAGLGVAAAQTDEEAPSSSTTEAPATAPADETKPERPARNETELTGETAEKVKAAALAAVPSAEIVRVETDDDGAPYEAHVRKADGTFATVKLDESFNVTSVEDDGEMRGHRGRHHKGGRAGDERGTAEATMPS